jgi:hypothetical protein
MDDVYYLTVTIQISHIVQRRFTMLYMNVLTWEPDKRDAVIERTKRIGLEHEGMKVVGTWADTTSGRCFQLCDVPDNMDPMLQLKANFAWNDIMKVEQVPVMDAGEMLHALESMERVAAVAH